MSKQELAQREVVRNELKETLRDIERLPVEYQLKRLMVVFDKHIVLNTLPIKITHYDFTSLVSSAKSKMVELPGNLKISGKEISNNDIRFVAMLESFIGTLNRLECLKKLPRIDITK